MAIVAKVVETEPARRNDTGAGYVDWGAIFAGSAVASAISMMLVAFGTALGLSAASLAAKSSMPAIGVVIAAGLWLLWLQVSASLGGGYVAGRLRRRIGDAQKHEVQVRDGLHGLAVWAVGVLIGALVAGWITTLGAAGAAAMGAGAASNPKAADMTSYYTDRLMRAGAPAPGAQAAAPAGQQTAQGAPASEPRAEIGRLLASNMVTSADSEDRTYLIQRISAATGLSEQEATKRLDDTLAAMKAKADQARRLSVLMGFITVASLLVSAVAAWWAAITGGAHRDDGVDHTRFVMWR